jgi:hypothetical protein
MVGIDSQSMVRGRPQRADLLEKHISMAGKKNLQAPQPPGSLLTDASKATPYAGEVSTDDDDDDDVDIVNVDTLSGQYSKKRQSRHKAYRKKREMFFEGGRDDYVPSHDVAVLHRSPSLYLRAAWKFDQDRKHIVNTIFRDGKVDVGAEVPLNLIIPSMVNTATPRRRRYHYQCDAPLPGHLCAVCKKGLDW